MHSYETEGRGRVVVTGVSVLLVWLLHLGLGAIDFAPQWWLSVPSFAGCYSSLHWLFDRYVWRLGLFRRLRLIQVPDLNGKWAGVVESSYSKAGPAHSVSVTVMQRWSKMALTFEPEHSRSTTTTAHLRTIGLPV